ncbi:hypothetical protein FLM52_00395 [bacterium Scap17]|nr:hypothetical protein [bacterium Scap17]
MIKNDDHLGVHRKTCRRRGEIQPSPFISRRFLRQQGTCTTPARQDDETLDHLGMAVAIPDTGVATPGHDVDGEVRANIRATRGATCPSATAPLILWSFSEKFRCAICS